MYRKSYSTDIDDYIWNLIVPYIPTEKPGGRPRDTDIREVVNGILFVVKNDCSWRKLPDDLLPWQTVYDYYNKWCKNGTWCRIAMLLLEYQILEEKHLPKFKMKV